MAKMAVKVRAIDPESPLYGYVRPGYNLVSVNGREVIDNIDFAFRSADEKVEMLFVDSAGRELDFTFEDLYPGALGLTFEDDRIKTCKCNCVFCFVRQQPKGMRKALYVRDEDYRLSFTHGNFITLSNTDENDLKRIIEQRLSPLYISVHTPDDDLRRKMLGNPRLEPLMPSLRRLAQSGIQMHTQVVLCPGLNDGANLERTIADLAGLYPQVATLAIVPVGLTRYRERLPKLRVHTKDEAAAVIRKVEAYQREYLSDRGSRFVWVADEFYLRSGVPLPPRSAYEDMAQFENGVGMAREFVTSFNYRRHSLKKLRSRKRVLFLTGRSAEGILRSNVVAFLDRQTRLRMSLESVPNRFWGRNVTVSGLLTGGDLLRAARAGKSEYDAVVLPPNCLNADDLFLDDMPLEQFRKKLGKPVFVGKYNIADTIREVFV